ncbi:hypothetical protein [Paenibacillus roseipurpureus]|uniref:Uncharacterized protein n=1 Tax=Paenibacillus roseopurpureus TaxID=2918901 RepID=A0AA96LLG5_9BACL|nr:hypothetical protein [Paenibacillus sp. MBLB1832]WNR44072.1 hypothetical protein MJB10_23725 [Paenibacillus sp. MBLB1832]
MKRILFILLFTIVTGCSVKHEATISPAESLSPASTKAETATLKPSEAPEITMEKKAENIKMTMDDAVALIKSKLDPEVLRISNIREDGIDHEGKYLIRQSSQATTVVIEWYHVDPVSQAISCEILKDSCFVKHSAQPIPEVNKQLNKKQKSALDMAKNFAKVNHTKLGYVPDITYIELRSETKNTYTFQIYNMGSGKTDTIDWLTVNVENNTVTSMFYKEMNKSIQKPSYDRALYSDVINNGIDKILVLPEVQAKLNENIYSLLIEERKDSKKFISLTLQAGTDTLEDFQFKIYDDGTIMRWYSEARSFLDLK